MRIYKILLLLFFSSTMQGQSASPIVTSFAAIDSLQQVAPRPMVIFLHTDWCRYCEHMQQTSFRDAKIVERLNEHFYFLSLDAETERTLSFGGHDFSFQPTGRGSGVHALAVALGTVDGQLQYPTLVVMNTAYEIIFQHGAFLDAGDLKRVLQF